MELSSLEYILNWNGVNGRVLSQGYIFDIEQKPKLSFEYDSLYYETELGNSFYYSYGQTGIVKDLSEEQIKEIQDYCDKFKDVMDYGVQAYRDDFVYIGNMTKSMAESAGYKYVLSNAIVPYTFCKLDSDGTWKPIFCAFDEDGRPYFNPAHDSSKYVTLMTESEYSKLPERTSPVQWFDFSNNQWVDKRKLNRVKLDGKMEVRGYFEHHNVRTGNGRIPAYEMNTWSIQYDEATKYLNDKSSSTPFIDAVMAEFTSEFPISKDDFCQKIINHQNEEELKKKGKLHGLMLKYIYRIENAQKNEEVDNIVTEVYDLIGRGRIINVYSKFPPTVSLIHGETKNVIMTDDSIYHTYEAVDRDKEIWQ